MPASGSAVSLLTSIYRYTFRLCPHCPRSSLQHLTSTRLRQPGSSLALWSSLGEQFLWLVLWSMLPEGPTPGPTPWGQGDPLPDCALPHPLFGVDDDKVDEVHEIAAVLMSGA